MDTRRLGNSALSVSPLCVGASSFGSGEGLLSALGIAGPASARQLVNSCLDSGVTFFDASGASSRKMTETVLGNALAGKRTRAVVSTNVCSGPHIVEECEASLRRLRTDYIDLYKVENCDQAAPLDQVLTALDGLVRAGKVRHLACMGLSSGQLTNALAASDRHGLTRFVGHEVYYSLLGRNYETELMQLSIDCGLGAIVSSPPGYARTTIDTQTPSPLPRVVETAAQISRETGKTIPQISLNWLLRKPTVTSVIVGVRNDQQLLQSVAAANWSLTDEQTARLDRASERVLTSAAH
jgi:aryl-alcohol dehydrogenase-like predicted oxidoreductase